MFSPRTERTIGEKPASAHATVGGGRHEIVVMESFVSYLDEHTDPSERLPTLLRPPDVAARLGVSKLVGKRQTWLARLDEKVLGLYAGGMRVRDKGACGPPRRRTASRVAGAGEIAGTDEPDEFGAFMADVRTGASIAMSSCA
jgi:hypothetical protein